MTVAIVRQQTGSNSNRGRKVMKMVVIIATLLVVVDAPTAALFMVGLIEE